MIGCSGNQLKLFAAISMLIDHIGVAFFPEIIGFRIIGRLSFPIFSYFIYEGYGHTHNKLRYFRRLFGLGMVCVLGYALFSGEFYGNVLLTFSVSIGVLAFFEKFCKNWEEYKPFQKVGSMILFGGELAALGVLCTYFRLDYGFLGALLPLFLQIGKLLSQKFHNSFLPLLFFAAGLFLLCLQKGGVQWYCLLSLPFLAMYNGQKGRFSFQYWFYWFYPIHLVLIGAVSSIL